MKYSHCKVFAVVVVLFCSPISFINAQVGIGTSTPEGMLDLESSTQGLVYPRVALTKTKIESPVKNPNTGPLVQGTIVYNTSKTKSGSNDVYPGIYAWDGFQWQPQFYMEEYEKFTQTGGDQRTTIRENLFDPNPNNADPIDGLSGVGFIPKYSGFYKIEVKTNFSGGKVADFSNIDEISLATAEGAFFFKLSGAGVDIDPTTGTYDYKKGWIYTHSYSTNNVTEGTGANAIDNDKVAHYASVVYYKYLRFDESYTFTLSNCITIGSEYFVNGGDTGEGQGHIGLEIPCSVEFTFVGTDNPQN
ncbi:hypothetical protein [Nonlabens antarcticus]|uniref:hypothetical protein n=1 Tax=Nonlabens antarcticus TaxID=392714 RepID=UPI001890E9CC|nr:hypothetical protein [Nonlabens antarcticus]